MGENVINIVPSVKNDQKPKSPGQIISAFLLDHSPTFRELAALRQEGWSDEGADKHFQNQRKKADEASNQTQRAFYTLMKRIGDELQATTQVLSLPTAHSKVLDICIAPGGYSASVLQYSPQAHISAITLPRHFNGFHVMVDYGYKDPRVNVLFADVTMFAAEYGITDIPKDHPDFEKLVSRRPFAAETFDLVFCDGQRLKPGGTFIILLHKPEMWNTVKLLNLFDTISNIQLLKPIVAHKTRSSFYLVAKNVQTQHPEALRAIADWKSTWKKLAFPPSPSEKEAEQQQPIQTQMEIRKAHDLLTGFGERLLKLGKPVWLIQGDALKNAPWLKNKTTRPSGHTDGPSESPTLDVLAEKSAPSSVWSDLYSRQS